MKIGEMIMPRVVFGKTLVKLGYDYKKLVVFDADVAASTQTRFFRDTFPDRFYEMGIAEANMIGAAAGMATTGFLPFVSTFAVFLANRAIDQIRVSIAYTGLNVKLNGAYGGLPTGKAGATHTSIGDIASMRTLPGMTIIIPADPLETEQATELALKINGPVYLRTVRCQVPVIFDSSHRIEVGKAETVHEGKDAVIISTGMMTTKSLKAAEILKREGISVKVIHMATIKPIDEDAIIKASREFGHIITVENHSIIGGLGGAVAEVSSKSAPCRITRLGFRDVFPESGDNELLFSRYGMNTGNIAETVKKVLKTGRRKQQ